VPAAGTGELSAWLGKLSCGDQILVKLVDVVEDLAQEQAHAQGASQAAQLKQHNVFARAFAFLKKSPKPINKQAVQTTTYQAAVVTINRAAQRNAMSLAMWQEVGRIFKVLGQQQQVRAIILTGAGDHFSAGADIAEFSKVRATIEQGVEYEKRSTHAVMPLQKRQSLRSR